MTKLNLMKPMFCGCLGVLLSLSACIHEDQHHQNHDHGHHQNFSEKASLTSSISSKYLGSYEINDDQHNTQVTVVVSDDTRTITSNALPNHATGQFPNKGNPNTISAQSRKWVLPLTPEFTGDARWVREAGVAVNGVKFEPETNERVACESGETYRIEAQQDMVDLGLDVNNAHVQPTGEYHYHGVSQNLVDFSDQGNDLVHIGFAADGFLIMYSKGEVYKPSYQLKTEARSGTDCVYTTPHSSQDIDIDGTTPDGTYVSDWQYVEGFGDLDSCDGIKVDGQYVYIASEQYPYIGRCVNGKLTDEQGGKRRGPPPGGDHSRGRPPRGS